MKEGGVLRTVIVKEGQYGRSLASRQRVTPGENFKHVRLMVAWVVF